MELLRTFRKFLVVDVRLHCRSCFQRSLGNRQAFYPSMSPELQRKCGCVSHLNEIIMSGSWVMEQPPKSPQYISHLPSPTSHLPSPTSHLPSSFFLSALKNFHANHSTANRTVNGSFSSTGEYLWGNNFPGRWRFSVMFPRVFRDVQEPVRCFHFDVSVILWLWNPGGTSRTRSLNTLILTHISIGKTSPC